jgi:hypothetical protein
VEIHFFCGLSDTSSALGAPGLGFPHDAKLIHNPLLALIFCHSTV